jgi:hypothetical protein
MLKHYYDKTSVETYFQTLDGFGIKIKKLKKDFKDQSTVGGRYSFL